MNRIHTTLALATFAALGLAIVPAAYAQSYTLSTLATFNASVSGANPQASLTLSGTTLYGTTSSGGPSGGGTVFSLPTIGGTPTVLASFDSSTNATTPESSLLLSGSKLYGTTFGVATADTTLGGTVFSVPTTGTTATTVASFNADTNGQFPNGANSSAGLVLSGTTLYGTTQYGGTPNQGNGGTVFSVPLAGGTPTVLLNFFGSNGETPESGLTLVGSTLYGTTYSGGAAGGYGSVFSVSTTGTAPTVLASFSSTTGQGPTGGLTLVGSTFYGLTTYGGTGNGTLYSVAMNASGATPTTLVNFDGTNTGGNPLDSLILGSNNILYGTTQDGGANGDGTVFSFNPTTSTLTTIASFNGTNGANPLGGLTLGANGVLYGMTSAGGDAAGDGIVFSLTPVAAPEPSAWAVFGFGVVGLLALRLRARRSVSRFADSPVDSRSLAIEILLRD